jgi:hypothetical protein
MAYCAGCGTSIAGAMRVDAGADAEGVGRGAAAGGDGTVVYGMAARIPCPLCAASMQPPAWRQWALHIRRPQLLRIRVERQPVAPQAGLLATPDEFDRTAVGGYSIAQKEDL